MTSVAASAQPTSRPAQKKGGPFTRYVAIGDSFTEGVGDPDPSRPNGVRGWADRVADVLALQSPDFSYANLAIRGRKLPGILAEQLPVALDLQPDLVTFNGGGNDVLRPSVDIDRLAESIDDAVGQLTATGATVLVFSLPDTRSNPSFRVVRGRIALYNEFLREIVDLHGAVLLDMWRDHNLDRHQLLNSDRLHLNPIGHHLMAIQVLKALAVEHGLEPYPLAEPLVLNRRQLRAEQIEWLRTFLIPWIARRLTGRSSGDGVLPKYPTLTSLSRAAGFTGAPASDLA